MSAPRPHDRIPQPSRRSGGAAARLVLLLAAAALALVLPASHRASAHDHAAPFPQAPAAGEGQAATAPGLPSTYDVPPYDVGAETLARRAEQQRATAGKLRVPYDFTFTDRLPESGITFVHKIVDDAGKTYKQAHYDHGNGIAAADVDGDGRTDLYFTTQLGSNELWRNLGGGKFENITARAGVAMTDRISVAPTFADVDNDGDPDLHVTTVRTGNALFENDGKGNFRDVSKQAGLDYVGHSSAAVFFDYDRDGKLDLFLVNVGKYTGEEKGRGGYYVAYEDAFSGHLKPERTERSILFRNLGGNRFADVSEQAKLADTSWSGDATFLDLNQDGWLDLYVLNMQGDNHYYENAGGKAFVDRTAERFPKTPWGAMGVKAFDYDLDGDMDLFVTDMHSDMVRESSPDEEKVKFLYKGEAAKKFFHDPDDNIFGNAFYRNLGDGPTSEISQEVGLENYWPWGVSVDDLNADGWPDVFITASMNFPYRYGINSVMLNNRGAGFLDSEFLLGVEPLRGGRTRKDWFTLDCSGPDRNYTPCAGRSGTVTVTGTLGSRSSVIFDLEGDGDLDVVTNELHSEPQVLVSDLAQKRKVRWLAVRLEGRESNRDGLGATVKVVAGGRTLTQVMDGTSGYLSHSVLPLYFGLGEGTGEGAAGAGAGAVDRIEVVWPSGRKQTVEGPIPANQPVEIVEGPSGKYRPTAGVPARAPSGG